MDEICVTKFDVYECRKSDRASALSGAQLNICAAQTPEFPDTIPTIVEKLVSDIIQEQISKGSISLSISAIASHQQDPTDDGIQPV